MQRPGAVDGPGQEPVPGRRRPVSVIDQTVVAIDLRAPGSHVSRHPVVQDFQSGLLRLSRRFPKVRITGRTLFAECHGPAQGHCVQAVAQRTMEAAQECEAQFSDLAGTDSPSALTAESS